jgi:hypothetical protein
MRTRVMPFVILVALVAFAWLAPAQLPAARNFVAHLSGDEEVPPVDTQAQGQAIFQLNAEGDALSFRLLVANIEDVTQAHIHCGAAGVNGPVVVFLFGLDPAGVTVNGVLSQGTITEDDIIARPDSPECPGGVASFDDLLAKMRSGDTYTNVHTLVNPGGEIRGQNAPLGPPSQ